MELFNLQNQGLLRRLAGITNLLQEGLNMDLDLTHIQKKIDSVRQMIQDGKVRIVLLGSFSDGKTTAIAGLMGQLKENMKISPDESSDQLSVYYFDGLKSGFEIVDTPGLFGSKEKEVDGKNVKFSTTTERYFSEAHIVLYVCDAVVPLKESHVPILHRVMRKFNKLDNTIFVINKMDEAGYDLTDDEDYESGVNIKKENLISRLRETMDLTSDEESRLNIVCIAADPKGKGLGYWLNKIDDYVRRSRIGLLREMVTNVVENCNVGDLRNNTAEESLKDILGQMEEEFEEASLPIKRALTKSEEIKADLQVDCQYTKGELLHNRKEVLEGLKDLKSNVLMEIKHANEETLEEVIQTHIGTDSNGINFYQIVAEINQVLDYCYSSNDNALHRLNIKFEKVYSFQEGLIKDALKTGAGTLKNVKISGDMVKTARNYLAKGFKFKPWGAIKLGQKATKAAGGIGVAISLGLEVHDWYKKAKRQKEVENIKKELTDKVNEIFSNVMRDLETEEKYLATFGAAYQEMMKQYKEKEAENEVLKKQLQKLEAYKERIKKWNKESTEDVEYEIA